MINRTSSPDLPLVSIVILNYNKKYLSAKCIAHLLRVTNYPNFEVIFVDNGSVDGSAQFIKRMFEPDARVKVVELQKNYGYALGNNIGASIAKGKYIAFINNDVIVTSNWLNELINALEKDTTIGAVQGKILRAGSNQIDSTGMFIDYFGNVIKRAGKEPDSPEFNYVSEIFSVSGSCFVVRKDAYREVGEFNKNYFLMFEEIDLSWRLQLAGYRIVYIPTSIVHHMVGTTTKEIQKRLIRFHETKNKLMTFLKNADLKGLIVYNPFIAIFGALILDLIRKQKCNADVIMPKLEAIWWIFRNFKAIMFMRKKVLRKSKVSLLPTKYSTIFRLFICKWRWGYDYSMKFYYQQVKKYIEKFGKNGNYAMDDGVYKMNVKYC
jgi:GT2 family glycosyltransferase